MAPLRVELTKRLAHEFGLWDQPGVTVAAPDPAANADLIYVCGGFHFMAIGGRELRDEGPLCWQIWRSASLRDSADRGGSRVASQLDPRCRAVRYPGQFAHGRPCRRQGLT
jgi:hypothetical protein